METNLQKENLSTVKKFYDALAQKDISAIADLFDDKILFEIPLSPTGDPKPWVVFDGKEKTMEYLKGACAMFSQLIWKEPVYTASADGKRVFVQAHGNLIKADGNVPYENVYVYTFDIENGKFTYISEYANPVTISKLLNMPVG